MLFPLFINANSSLVGFLHNATGLPGVVYVVRVITISSSLAGLDGLTFSLAGLGALAAGLDGLVTRLGGLTVGLGGVA